ncbi:phospholipase D family protein [Salmonella enterica]|nr:phospholipase D family protein [Salmonella enterica]
MKKAGLFLSLLLTFSVPALSADIEAGFSPEGSAQQLVLDAIKSAKSNIRMMAYSFTAPDIMRALIAARNRGVDVKIVIDKEGNTNRSSRAAINLVTNAGIELRTDDNYKIQHDKVMIIDDNSIQTGSFNYTASAERYNSENAIVIRNQPELAQQYLEHWRSRWEQGKPWRSDY